MERSVNPINETTSWNVNKNSFDNFWYRVQGDLTPDALDPRTIGHNIGGLTYAGPDNPKNYRGQDNYSYLPKDPTDLPAMLHDLRYDALGIKGKEGLTKDKRAIGADDEFVKNELLIGIMFSNPLIRAKAFALGYGLLYLSLPKRSESSQSKATNK